ncbi:MAG: 4'-phosphopantetheinyl transferase superfamily protein [Longimonas sp.]|uniref:4'-phosphopantetheinyl transferase family protein n=1 Tax=Longimonas sp. TaxID=2039626 RepID=UPI00335E784B
MKRSAVYTRWCALSDGQPALLRPDERARLRSFGDADRRRSFVAGRTALKRLVAQHRGVPPGDAHIHVAPDDSLLLDGPFYGSLAHSGDWAMAVLSLTPIGVDLERIQPRDPDVARFLFAPTDRDTLYTLPGSFDEQLILAWTLKEAVLKARRSGFRCSPKSIQLAVDARTGTARAVVTRSEPHDHWHLTFGRRQDYWWAWAVPE